MWAEEGVKILVTVIKSPFLLRFLHEGVFPCTLALVIRLISVLFLVNLKTRKRTKKEAENGVVGCVGSESMMGEGSW